MEINSFSENSSGGTWFLSLPVYIYIEQGSPSVLQTHQLPWIWERKSRVWDTARDSTVVLSHPSPTQPATTQLLWVATQMRIWPAPPN